MGTYGLTGISRLVDLASLASVIGLANPGGGDRNAGPVGFVGFGHGNCAPDAVGYPLPILRHFSCGLYAEFVLVAVVAEHATIYAKDTVCCPAFTDG